jgi:hypothetical protein
VNRINKTIIDTRVRAQRVGGRFLCEFAQGGVGRASAGTAREQARERETGLWMSVCQMVLLSTIGSSHRNRRRTSSSAASASAKRSPSGDRRQFTAQHGTAAAAGAAAAESSTSCQRWPKAGVAAFARKSPVQTGYAANRYQSTHANTKKRRVASRAPPFPFPYGSGQRLLVRPSTVSEGCR